MAREAFTIDVDGAAQLRRTLRKAGADAADLKDANAAAAAIVARAGAAAAPRRTGRLAASVRGNRAVGAAVVRAGGARVPYAAPIHWGWPRRGIAAQPFLSDAARATEALWLAAFFRDMQSICDTVRGV
ncbi:HK97 gp10 family phage protein [Phytomonospora endophytica]|uniref:HK97 gp10 family phage protein n=1 Tax=Phytomonospora endophytica TaxID=714109 RepID=A0A841G0Y4_9ACTN|nr:HK97 gp10 family phage protein [Phytomonospora endophytica]MBB6039317.1 hypothetical protein [Phytomonospora endophytica]GIG69741.1 hypothetical protein Pen01_60360 [Phytomonospora endophytica]